MNWRVFIKEKKKIISRGFNNWKEKLKSKEKILNINLKITGFDYCCESGNLQKDAFALKFKKRRNDTRTDKQTGMT